MNTTKQRAFCTHTLASFPQIYNQWLCATQTEVQILFACSLTLTLKLHILQGNIFLFDSLLFSLRLVISLFSFFLYPHICPRPALTVAHTDTNPLHRTPACLHLVCWIREFSSTWQVLADPERDCQGFCWVMHMWAQRRPDDAWISLGCTACLRSLFTFLLQWHA